MAKAKSYVEYLNPEGLPKNPAFSQAVAVKSNTKTIYVGGQNAVNKAGKIVGKKDMKQQAEQVLKNLKIALKAGGATFGNIIKWNIYVLQGQPIQPGLEAFQKEMKTMPGAPVITVVFVAALGNPDFLLEVEAVAVIPEGEK